MFYYLVLFLLEFFFIICVFYVVFV